MLSLSAPPPAPQRRIKGQGHEKEDLDHLYFARGAGPAAHFWLITVYNCSVMVGGPVEKMWFFQMALTPPLSVSTCSTRCQYDILKVWLKKMTTSLPAVLPKFTFFVY
jgi:hypothetical protein